MTDPAPTTDVATTTPTPPAIRKPVEQVRDLLEKAKPQLALALPKHLTADRLLRVALTAVQRTPDLLNCDRLSLLGAIMQAAQLGLEPDGVLGHAYLVPFGSQVQLIPGYKGLIALARRSGEISSIAAHVVYERDQFIYAYGLDEKLIHVPAATDERGKAVYAYAVARFKDGGHAFEVMSFQQIEAIRKLSRAATRGPWVTHWDEMARKTVIRRLAKYLPLSVEFQRAAALGDLADAELPQDLSMEVDISTPAFAAARAIDAETQDERPKTRRLADELKEQGKKTPAEVGKAEKGETP